MSLFLALTLAGCGGGGIINQTAGKTTGSISIVWPPPSRLLPKACNSVVVKITDGTTVISTKTLARPATGGTTTASFTDLPLGTFSLSATAYPTTTGTGVAQANGSAFVTTSYTKPFTTTVTMDSTIVGFTVNGLPTTTPAEVEEYGSKSISITAIDAAGNIVLTRAADLIVTGGGGVASYDAGVLTGIAAGSTSLTIKDSDSGKTATLPVNVTPFPDGNYVTTQTGGALIRIIATATLTAPNANPTRWIYAAPYGTDISDQQLVSTSSRVLLASGALNSTVKTEPSGFNRNYYGGDFASTLLSNPRVVPVQYDITTRTAKRNLSPGRPTTLPADLTPIERIAYTAETTRCNFRSAGVQAWINSHNLWKQTGETSIDLAKRICSAMKSDFTYAIIPVTDAAGHISLKQGDCGGLALVIQAALRANSIPCRFISGGTVIKSGGPLDPNLPSSWTTCGHHATLEMWHRTAGWIRVDGSNAVNQGASNVGWDDDDFVALSAGEEFVAWNTLGWSPLWILQTPAWGFFGSGDFSNTSTSYSWTVTRS
ncbi:MAG TPA: transglutaminase-like domain-containing protein [Fimbriimonas sp.]|nr:transglutaminase-like domain-containing protein [Fimbriimonas sp.]